MIDQPTTLTGRCATCQHWMGDKDKAAKLFAESPISMHRDRGYPNTGTCQVDHDWSEIEVDGDACVYLDVNANFGCVYWEDNDE